MLRSRDSYKKKAGFTCRESAVMPTMSTSLAMKRQLLIGRYRIAGEEVKLRFFNWIR